MTDVLVIGSGFGGLTAAALAARSGLQVTLVERHTRPGGCAGDFALGGFWFPAGATVVTGLEEGGILRRVFDTLGVPVDSTALDPSIVFHTPDGVFPYAASVDAWKASLAGLPGSGQYQRFWDWTHTAGGAVYRIGAQLPSLPLESFADLRRTVRSASLDALKTLPLLGQTVGHVKRRLGARGSPVIDSMIDALLMDATGAPAAECSAVQGAIALDLYRRGCQWVDGGTGRLAMQLVRSIRGNGGSVRFGVEAASLNRQANGWSATLSDGEQLTADRVIANVPPATLARLRGQRVELPREGSAWGAFVLHLGIDATGLETMHPYHQVMDAYDAGHGASLVSIFPARRRGQPRWSISVSSHVRPSAWRGWDRQNACARLAMEERLLTHVEQVIPGVRDRIILRRSATPATFERFTARAGGFVGGIVQRPSVVALRAPGHRPGQHLWMAGDHVFPGQGTVGTALSGINAYRDAVESLGGKALL